MQVVGVSHNGVWLGRKKKTSDGTLEFWPVKQIL